MKNLVFIGLISSVALSYASEGGVWIKGALLNNTAESYIITASGPVMYTEGNNEQSCQFPNTCPLTKTDANYIYFQDTDTNPNKGSCPDYQLDLIFYTEYGYSGALNYCFTGTPSTVNFAPPEVNMNGVWIKGFDNNGVPQVEIDYYQ